jgi:ATP-dependent Lon protease
MEGRKRVKDQLLRIDPTYAKVNFGYRPDGDGSVHYVKTLEEKIYPQHYYKTSQAEVEPEDLPAVPTETQVETAIKEPPLKEQHISIEENQRGVSFDQLFGPYIRRAQKITLTDPFIRLFFQVRNLKEFIETVAKHKIEADEIDVHLITVQDEFDAEQQVGYFEQIQTNSEPIGIHFTWEFADKGSIHARHIVTDNGWKILLDRGLDIYQRYEMNDAFALANRLQQYRACKAFEVTYLRTE